MSGIEKQIAYWRKSSRQDLRVAKLLLDQRKTRHGLFFLHLETEKLLKGLTCKTTGQPAPRIHSLPILAQRAAVTLSPAQWELLAGFDRFNIAGRYPDDLTPLPRHPQALKLTAEIKRVYQCLNKQF